MALTNNDGHYMKVNLGNSRLLRNVACDLYASADVRQNPSEFDRIQQRMFSCEAELADVMDDIPVLAEGQTLRDAIVSAQYNALKASGQVSDWQDC